jgi:hypothetical protein
MAAAIQKRVHPAVVVADDHDGHPTHGPRYEVAGICQLGFMRKESPGSIENTLQFQPVHLVAHEDITAHKPLLNIDPGGFAQAFRLGRHGARLW